MISSRSECWPLRADVSVDDAWTDKTLCILMIVLIETAWSPISDVPHEVGRAAVGLSLSTNTTISFDEMVTIDSRDWIGGVSVL
jgi:hypothetical protein